MKNNLTPYLLSVCAAAAMLAGCGGSTQFSSPTGQAPTGNAIASKRVASPGFVMPERIDANSSGTEVLIGKAKLIKPCHTIRGKHGKNQGSSTNFGAHGNATGPYPGIFTASGGWTISSNSVHQPFWTFAETFTITTGSSTISGTMNKIGFSYLPFTCTVVENLTVPYTIGSVSGNAVISIIQKQDFSERLHGL
jgi:hypothetical protein